MDKDKIKPYIAARVAKELKDGDVANLGVGIPTMVPAYLPGGVKLTLQSENGFIGISGEEPTEEDARFIVNAGGFPVSIEEDGAFFTSADSFSIIRGGHVDVTVLGALQVAQNGDIANWIVPGGMVSGMGGAMDLVVGAKKVIISMLHTQKGAHKILDECTLPYTALKVVDMIITEMGVMEITDEGVVLKELHPDYTLEEIKAATGCELIISPDLKPMEEE